MDDSNGNYPRNSRMNEHLGVNKMGKNIRKSPLHQPNFGNPKQPPQQQQQQQQQQPQPQVYNISKTDFRSIVQQLTGSPSHHDQPPPPRPAGPRHNPPKPHSLRLQKIRPPPLSPINRPTVPPPLPPPIPFNNNSNPNPNSNPNSPFFVWPSQFSPLPAITPGPGDPVWNNTAESPISAYMRYLQNSMIDSGGQVQPSTAGLLPTPPNAPVFPSPRGNVPSLLPSPSSQFPFPSPSSFLNLFSPRSPYPLPSPGFQYPLSPSFQFSPLASANFSLSPLPQQASGILGPGPQQPPLSPSIFFPTSPSGFLPLKSPRWRE